MIFAIPHLALATGGLVAFAICMVIVLTKHMHGGHTLDFEKGVQKVHDQPTPRIGGIAILLGLGVGYLYTPSEVQKIFGPMLLASLPAFLAGAIEDLIKRDSVTERLLATFASGVLAWWLTGVSLNRIGLPGFDNLLAIVPLSVVFTAFALSGVANAINIIDGFNGLAGGAVLLCLATLGLIAFQSNDAEMAKICFVIGGAIFGFILVNYPRGKIFLGDGGAYLLGFLLGWIAVLIVVRNPTVSPWSPLLACGYPILEVLFSMGRRWARTLKMGHPDRLHLHSLIWSRVVRKNWATASKIRQNATVMPLVLLYALLPAYFSITHRTSTAALIASFLFCAFVYACLYARLVHFSWTLPKFLPSKKKQIC